MPVSTKVAALLLILYGTRILSSRASAPVSGPRLARLSIYDQLNGLGLEAQLERPTHSDPAALKDLIIRRMI